MLENTVEENAIIKALDEDEWFHFPLAGDAHKAIQAIQDLKDKTDTVRKFLEEVRTHIESSIESGCTFVHVNYGFRESLTPELQETVLKFLESKGYKIYDRNFENGDALRFEIAF